MHIHRTIIAAMLALGTAGPAFAQATGPIQDQAIDLGRVAGDIYYTVHPDGFHVVATFAEPNEGAAPLRFATVLAPEQTVIVSTPHGPGTAPEAVEITRHSNHVVVRKTLSVD